MTKDPILYLTHICDAIIDIASQLKGVTREAFDASIVMQGFVERKLEIIGEATKNIPDEFKQEHPYSLERYGWYA